jgi:hypothetical protein
LFLNNITASLAAPVTPSDLAVFHQMRQNQIVQGAKELKDLAEANINVS